MRLSFYSRLAIAMIAADSAKATASSNEEERRPSKMSQTASKQGKDWGVGGLAQSESFSDVEAALTADTGSEVESYSELDSEADLLTESEIDSEVDVFAESDLAAANQINFEQPDDNLSPATILL